MAMKLMDSIRTAIRTRHFSPRTEEAYTAWVRRFLAFHRMKHPAEMGEPEICAFVGWLAVERKVAASTQNQALAALLFLYRDVLNRSIEGIENIIRAKRPERLPIVLTREEVRAVLENMSGTAHLVARLLYGSGSSPFGRIAIACERSRFRTM
jgi:integrase